MALQQGGGGVNCFLLCMPILPRSLIFEIKHCLMDFYTVCSNGSPGVKMAQQGAGCVSWVQH